MKASINNILTVDQTELWKDCVFVFDTSALLHFYLYSEQARNAFFEKVLTHVKDRLWMPEYVCFEYLKNRKEVFLGPLTYYNDISKQIDSFVKNFNELQVRTKDQDRHPTLNQNLFNDFRPIMESYKEKFTVEIALKKKSIEAIAESDTVLSSLESLFNIGEPFSFDKLLAIVEEGELRYKNSIPPGYKDAGDKDKEGLQIYGDLIIWKQIIEYAKVNTKNIAFVINDTKTDWFRRGKKGEVFGPRYELIREFHDLTHMKFGMYTIEQFFTFSSYFMKLDVHEDIVNEIAPYEALKNIMGESQMIELIYNFGLNLFDSDQDITSKIAESNAYAWGVDTWDILLVHVNDNDSIVVDVQFTFTGEQDEDSSFTFDSLSLKASLELEREGNTWSIERYELGEIETDDTFE